MSMSCFYIHELFSSSCVANIHLLHFSASSSTCAQHCSVPDQKMASRQRDLVVRNCCIMAFCDRPRSLSSTDLQYPSRRAVLPLEFTGTCCVKLRLFAPKVCDLVQTPRTRISSSFRITATFSTKDPSFFGASGVFQHDKSEQTPEKHTQHNP